MQKLWVKTPKQLFCITGCPYPEKLMLFNKKIAGAKTSCEISKKEDQKMREEEKRIIEEFDSAVDLDVKEKAAIQSLIDVLKPPGNVLNVVG